MAAYGPYSIMLKALVLTGKKAQALTGNDSYKEPRAAAGHSWGQRLQGTLDCTVNS